MATLYYESQICHHGIKGQKWGVRRYQNEDGTLTRAGKAHKLNREASEERGSKIASDKTKHFGSSAVKVASVNIGASAAKDTIDRVSRFFWDMEMDNMAPKFHDTAESKVMREVLRDIGKFGSDALEDVPDIIGIGQIVYNAYGGIKMARDIYDYHNYKKSKMSKMT